LAWYHVIYPEFNDQPASGSAFWLKDVLRKQLHFDGVIFSDDLSMEGAAVLGNHAQRAEAALNAGCDLLLACNNREGTLTILEALSILNEKQSLLTGKVKQLLVNTKISYTELINSDEWRIRHNNLMKLNEKWEDYYASCHH